MSPRIAPARVALGRHEPSDPKQLQTDRNPDRSHFRDLLYVTLDDRARRESAMDPFVRGRQGFSEILPRGFDIEAARVRLKMDARAAQCAKFDLSAAGAPALIPVSQLPPALAERYELAARNRATVATALGAAPIPAGTGMTVSVVQLESGAAIGIQEAENDSTGIGNTDPTFGLPSSAIAYAAGYVDVSRQLLDRSAEGAKIDQVIARELGACAGELIDAQLLDGTGSDGQITGLLGLAGNTVTYTSGTPTPAGLASKLGELHYTVWNNYGTGPDTLIWAPRRAAFALSQSDTGDSVRRVLSLYDNVVQAPAMPTTLNSTQDAIIALRREATHAFADSRFEIHADAKSGTLEVRIRVIARVALVLGSTDAVAKMTGTGLAAPNFA